MRIVIVESGTSNVDAEMRQELLDWASALGLNVKKATPDFLLAESADGDWSAHFSIKRGPAGDPDGLDVIRPGTNRVQIDYGSVQYPVEQASWPTWFGHAEEVPDMPIPAMLELLDVAADARLQLRVTSRRNNRMVAFR